MSNFFSEALNDLEGLEEKILGPDYPYHKFIKSPSEMGMSASGSKIATNIGGLISYVDVLVTGRGKASTTGQPLGDKFFLTTGATCKDKATGEDVTRSLYVNNIPDGSIPFISGMTGASFTDFEGLVPGAMSDMANLNPLAIFQAFMLGANPECQSLTMDTVDANNVRSTDTAFVATADINNMNACWFRDRKNPVSGDKCREAFSQRITPAALPENKIKQAYIAALGFLGLYIACRLMSKK